MTREFKVGDEIIMTADSGKGDVNFYPNGDHKGKVVEIDETMIDVFIEGYPGANRTFHKHNLINICYPGLSIRHADEVRDSLRCKEHPAYYLDDCPLCKKVATPQKQEWVKGQVPQYDSGWFYVNYTDTGVQLRRVYADEPRKHTHYMKAYIQLPPPPPVEEVEAYGMLEAIDKLIPVGTPITDTMIAKISLYRHFFFLPATTENLNRYFITRGGGAYDVSVTLDQFINWYKREYPNQKLIFTAAALEALGVK